MIISSRFRAIVALRFGNSISTYAPPHAATVSRLRTVLRSSLSASAARAAGIRMMAMAVVDSASSASAAARNESYGNEAVPAVVMMLSC
jgi:hypothetical protein